MYARRKCRAQGSAAAGPGATLDGVSFSHLIADPTGTPPPEQREFALVELFLGFRPQWDDPAEFFRRSVVHESGYRYVHQLFTDPPPTDNAPEELLHVPTDPDEQTNLAQFGPITYGLSPCPPFQCIQPTIPCNPPYPCDAPIQTARSLNGVSCGSEPLCDLGVLYDLFDRLYAPFYCECLTSN